MAISYDPALPTARDRMRFTLGDINDPPLRPDTSYDALLAQYDEATATYKMAESLASEYAQNPSSVNVGGVSVSYSTLVQNWQGIAKTFREGSGGPVGQGASTTFFVDRYGSRVNSEYRRPVDWIPGDETGDGW